MYCRVIGITKFINTTYLYNRICNIKFRSPCIYSIHNTRLNYGYLAIILFIDSKYIFTPSEISSHNPPQDNLTFIVYFIRPQTDMIYIYISKTNAGFSIEYYKLKLKVTLKCNQLLETFNILSYLI